MSLCSIFYTIQNVQRQQHFDRLLMIILFDLLWAAVWFVCILLWKWRILELVEGLSSDAASDQLTLHAVALKTLLIDYASITDSMHCWRLSTAECTARNWNSRTHKLKQIAVWLISTQQLTALKNKNSAVYKQIRCVWFKKKDYLSGLPTSIYMLWIIVFSYLAHMMKSNWLRNDSKRISTITERTKIEMLLRIYMQNAGCTRSKALEWSTSPHMNIIKEWIKVIDENVR